MKFLCCGSLGDQTDGNDQPSRPTHLPNKVPQVEDVNTGINTAKPAIPPTTDEGVSPIEEKPDKLTNFDKPDNGKPDNGKPDLWKEAFDSLDKDRQDLISQAQTGSTTDAINGVIEHTRKEYTEWQKNGLKVKRKGGDDIDVRAVSEKILNCALQAKDMISNIAAFDPTGKGKLSSSISLSVGDDNGEKWYSLFINLASAAWTVVSFGLTMVSNHIERRDAMFASSEYLAETLAYYALVDTHYRVHNVEGGQNFDRALVRVYTAVLDYTAEVNKVKQESTIGRVARSLKSLADQYLVELKATIEEQQIGAEKWADFVNTIRDRERAREILNDVDQTLALAKDTHPKVLSDEERRIMAWVSDYPISTAQKRTQGYRTPNTGTWLLESQEYNHWKSSPGSVLWLPGVVGCGKSVLCSTVIADIDKLCEEDSSKSIGYWYFEFTPDKPHDVESMMRCLIRQLCRSPLPPSITKCWEQHGMKGTEPSREGITTMLHDVVSSIPSDVFVIIDALDECPAADKERHHLLSLLLNLVERHGSNIHILATSRPEQDIQAAMREFPWIDLQQRLAKDVETFVRAAMEDEYLQEADEDIKSSIVDALLNTGERRFRWAALQIIRFKECATNDDIRDALRTIPENLEETYQRILDNIKKNKKQSLARQMLMLLAFAAGPLDLKTIAFSAGLRLPNYVLDICTLSLLSVSDGVVRLAHFSVKEFLVVEKHADDGNGCRFSEIAAREMLATKTVDLLLEQTTELTGATTVNKPFLVYAAKYWSTHIKALGDISLWPAGLLDKVDRLFTEPTVYFNWLRIAESAENPKDYQWNKSLEECRPPIFDATDLSLVRTVDILVDQGADPLQGFGSLKCPFMKAVETGRLELVDLLLKKNLPIDTKMAKHIMWWISVPGGTQAHETSKSLVRVILDTMRKLGLLRDPSQSSEKNIPENFIRGALFNQTAGLEILGQLLDWRDMDLVSFTLPSDAVRLATCFAGDLDKMLDLLFGRCEDEIQWPSTMFTRDGEYPMDFTKLAALVRRRPANLTMHDTLCYAMAAYFEPKDMEFVLQARPDIRVTGRVLEGAARNAWGPGVFQLLWSRQEQCMSITEDILVSAARNISSKDNLEFLIDELENGTRLSDKVIEQVIENDPIGLSMMKMLWGAPNITFEISARMIEIAASRLNAPLEMLELFMNNSMSEVPVTEGMVSAAAGNVRHASSLITYLSQMQEQLIPITENVLISAMESDLSIMETLMEKSREVPITNKAFLEACSNPPCYPYFWTSAGTVPQLIR
ncbi:hypothetical protein N7527_005564 [Penicillium freii]|nr:hypothetical protein N7527_005564 [Penicillium freii]